MCILCGFDEFDHAQLKSILYKKILEKAVDPKKLQRTAPSLLRQIKMKMRKQRPRPILMQRHSETCSQHYTIEFEVRQIPSSEIIERDRFLHVFWNVD